MTFCQTQFPLSPESAHRAASRHFHTSVNPLELLQNRFAVFSRTTVPLLHTHKSAHRADLRRFRTSTSPARTLAKPLCGIFREQPSRCSPLARTLVERLRGTFTKSFHRPPHPHPRETACRAVSRKSTFVKPQCYHVFNAEIVENRVEIV